MLQDVDAKTPRKPARSARMVRLARTYGAHYAGYAVLRRLMDHGWLGRASHMCLVEVFSASTAQLKSNRRVPRGLTVRPARQADQAALESYFEKPALVRNRLQRHYVCMMTLVRDRIGAAVWLALGPNECAEDAEELPCVYQIPAHTCFTFDGRGTMWGAWGSLMTVLPLYLQQEGVGEVVTLIDCNNQASLDAHRSLGYRSIGWIASANFFGRSLTRVKPRGGRWRPLPDTLGRFAVQEARLLV